MILGVSAFPVPQFPHLFVAEGRPRGPSLAADCTGQAGGLAWTQRTESCVQRSVGYIAELKRYNSCPSSTHGETEAQGRWWDRVTSEARIRVSPSLKAQASHTPPNYYLDGLFKTSIDLTFIVHQILSYMSSH